MSHCTRQWTGRIEPPESTSAEGVVRFRLPQAITHFSYQENWHRSARSKSTLTPCNLSSDASSWSTANQTSPAVPSPPVAPVTPPRPAPTCSSSAAPAGTCDPRQKSEREKELIVFTARSDSEDLDQLKVKMQSLIACNWLVDGKLCH